MTNGRYAHKLRKYVTSSRSLPLLTWRNVAQVNRDCNLWLLCDESGGMSAFIDFMEVKLISKDGFRVNEEIKAQEIRLVGETGEQLGIMSPRDAMQIAEENGLDLVEVAPAAKPPVCKIMDVGRYKYEQSKREREARKRQHLISVKEVKLRPNIEDNDFTTKIRNAIRFLEEGDKVKVTIMFRGREMSHTELGRELLARVADVVKDQGNVERSAKIEGRNMSIIISPK